MDFIESNVDGIAEAIGDICAGSCATGKRFAKMLSTPWKIEFGNQKLRFSKIQNFKVVKTTH